MTDGSFRNQWIIREEKISFVVIVPRCRSRFNEVGVPTHRILVNLDDGFLTPVYPGIVDEDYLVANFVFCCRHSVLNGVHLAILQSQMRFPLAAQTYFRTWRLILQHLGRQ